MNRDFQSIGLGFVLELPSAFEGQFIIVDGNSDHLFRPEDFIKEEAIQLTDDGSKTTNKNKEMREEEFFDVLPEILKINSEIQQE